MDRVTLEQARIGARLLGGITTAFTYEVLDNWSVNPDLILGLKESDCPSKRIDGRYFKQLAIIAEELLMMPRVLRPGTSEEVCILYPTVEMMISDVVDYLAKFNIQACGHEVAHELSVSNPGSGVRPVCMKEGERHLYYYKAGNLGGCLEARTWLNGDNWIPVCDFGKRILVPRGYGKP